MCNNIFWAHLTAFNALNILNNTRGHVIVVQHKTQESSKCVFGAFIDRHVNSWQDLSAAHMREEFLKTGETPFISLSLLWRHQSKKKGSQGISKR